MDRKERILEMLKTSPGDNFLRHALALEYIKANDDKTARNLFEQILNEDETYIGSYYHFGKLLERNGETQLAIEWYEKGMKAAKQAADNHAYNELQSAYEDLVY
jgi:Tfp pilus assembly protein PilF